MNTKIRIMPLAVLIIGMGISLAQEKSKEFPILKGLYLGQKPPGMVPEIFAPGIVSIEIMNHSTPVFSPDGKEVYWSKIFEEPSPKIKIIYSQFLNNRWTEPVITPDGRYLFFLSSRSGEYHVYWVSTKVIDKLRQQEYEAKSLQRK